MQQEQLPAVEIGPDIPAKAAVIWLHGLGADGYDFIDIVQQLHLPDELAIRFIFPHAPMRNVTLNNGLAMRAWFDMENDENGFRVNQNDVQQTDQAIKQLIGQQEQLGIPSNKIVLAGFSQGGAIALYTGLSYPKPLAGILALSTFLPMSSQNIGQFTSANQSTPIMMAHGTKDSIISLSSAENTRNALRQLAYQVNWKTYSMPHTVCLDEINDIATWFKKIF